MCKKCNNKNAKIIKKGFYLKKQKRKVQRYKCCSCNKTFSLLTSTPDFRMRKTHLKNKTFRLLCSGVSQRRAAFLLNVHHDTIARLLKCIAADAVELNKNFREHLSLSSVVFDEIETFEHSKCKPISIAVAVEDKTRKIISLKAAQMPAKGKLAEISRKKYGVRKDFRPEAINETLKTIKPLLKKNAVLKSDESPRYPHHIKTILPKATHMTHKGRRGCIVGQGELKRGGFDPLFYLNHTCAEIRDCVKRLSRKTWCTTKLLERLQMFLEMYMCFFNQKVLGIKKPILKPRHN